MAEAAATPSPSGGVERDYRHSLLIPVVLAAVVIALTNRFPAAGPLSGRLAALPLTTVRAVPAADPLIPVPPGAPIAVVAAADRSGSAIAASASPPAGTFAMLARPDPTPQSTMAGDPFAARNAGAAALGPRTRMCALADATIPVRIAAPQSPDEFGAALAASAEFQIRDFVVYNDDYKSISYPGGDVPALYGVCTDVVIRAYRALGIDLQRLVRETRTGAGDTSIDHRRTATLRRFFTRHGFGLPITDFAADYLPGDIVTYDRPQNRHGQSHVAVVANAVGPSGRPMIVHNRGWGPQMEDALFVDEITGHFRYSGQPLKLLADARAKRPGRGLNSLSILVKRAVSIRPSGRQSTPKTAPRS